MFYHVTWAAQRSRTLGQRLFLQFGLHCATHQIRIILVSCIVITSLFYPALAIYASSQPTTLSIIDTFRSATSVSAFDAQKDLEDLWSSHSGLRKHEDSISRAKCGMGRALRVERLLVQGHDSEEGALDRQTLLSTLELEQRLETLIAGGDTPCLKGHNGKCFVLSPLLFWNHDKEALLSDTNILGTLSSSENISLSGVSVTPNMVLAGKELRDSHAAGLNFDFAQFLAVTYFFPKSECLGTVEHTAWLQSVHKALAQDLVPAVQIQEPTLVALEFGPDLQKSDGWSALSAFLYLAYIGFFGYVAWSVGRMTAVHSRLGVTFTALVEIAVSTVTSLSVCALVGFKITMVPWEILPIVIVFVGAENMFNLVDAVGKTSVTLPVKQRIAEGLSRAGTSNTLKVVSYNTILGVIAVYSVGAIRQFCSFAIVVLIAHWFLAHTFFLAVLSIDLQRLELDELLRHDTSALAPTNPHISKDNATKPRSGVHKLVFNIQGLLKGRAATNLSLLVLLAITATLYYTTSTDDPIAVTHIGDKSRVLAKVTESHFSKKSTAWYIWKTLNPSQIPLLHLRVELPNIVAFNSNPTDTFQFAKKARPRFSMRTFRLVLWLLKIMVLPIAVTTSALWGLLLYLLKDTELLEAQRNRAEPDSQDTKEDLKALEGQIQFSTLPRAFASDVELIAASKDGKIIISVGLYNEIIIWRVDKHTHISIDATDVLRTAGTSSSASTLTSVSIDDDGSYCAVGTGAGVIAVWSIEVDHVRVLPPLTLHNASAGVTKIHFITVSGTCSNLLAAYENGVAVNWSLERSLAVQYITPSRRASIVNCSLVRICPLNRYLVAFSLGDGTLEAVETGDGDPMIVHDFCVQAGDSANIVTKVHTCLTELGGSARLIIAVATEAGLVTLWDGSTGECISVFDEVYGQINHLQVTPVHCETCHFCGQLPLESVCIAFSVDHVVRFFRLYVNDETRRCSCSRHRLRNVSSRDNLGRRSRSNSTISQTGSVSPSIPMARLATTFEASAFPVSGHGVHSRRASEKDGVRRSFETLAVPFPGDDTDSNPRMPFGVSSFWRDAVLAREMDVTCERGGWGVDGRRVIGVRRKPRPQGIMKGGTTTLLSSTSLEGLTPATLERWELWAFDPSSSRLQTSLLAALSSSPEHSCKSSTTATTSSSDCIPRLPFTRVSPLLIAPTHALAGFGNTVGIFHFCCP